MKSKLKIILISLKSKSGLTQMIAMEESIPHIGMGSDKQDNAGHMETSCKHFRYYNCLTFLVYFS